MMHGISARGWVGLVVTGLAIAGCGDAATDSDGSSGSMSRTLSGPPASLPALRAISSSGSFFSSGVCVLTVTGSVICWGSYLFDDSPTAEFESITLGHREACALDAVGSVACWGGNPDLGTDIILSTIGPVQDVIGHGLGPDNHPVSWGDLSLLTPVDRPYAQLSGFYSLDFDGTIRDWPLDDVVAEDSSFTQISGSGENVCALRLDGTVACFHARGLEPPVFVEELSRNDSIFTKIQTSLDGLVGRGCGLSSSSEIECWGDLEDMTHYDGFTFDIVPPAGTFVDFTLGPEFVCGITTDGALKCGGAPWWEDYTG